MEPNYLVKVERKEYLQRDEYLVEQSSLVKLIDEFVMSFPQGVDSITITKTDIIYAGEAYNDSI